MRTSQDGPTITYGNDNPQQLSNTDAGPNVDYQGNVLLDSRFVSAATGPGSAEVVPGWFSTSSLELLNYCPVTLSTTAIVSAATPTAGTPLTLVSTQSAGIAINVPIAPYYVAIQPTMTPVIAPIAIDFGFALGTTTTGASTSNILTITGPQSAALGTTGFYPGQRLCIPGAGLGGAALMTSVLATPFKAAPGQSLTAANTILLANPALTVVTASPIGTADPLYGVVALPMQKAGAAGIWDPAQVGSRVLQYVASAAYAGTVTVKGYDIYGQPMTETVTMNGTTPVFGLKAFKYIASATPSLTSASTISIGTTNLVGYPQRVDLWEFTNSFYNLAFLTTPTSFVAGSTATPTATTGDVRGTVSPGTITTGQRLVVYGNPRLFQCMQATNIDPRTVVGQTQF